MTDTKHTPGPWEIAEPKHPDPRQIEDRLIFANVNGERLHVAEVYQYQNHNNREANGTAIANALLIATSPELLSGCYMAKGFIETVCRDRNQDPNETDIYQSICAALAEYEKEKP